MSNDVLFKAFDSPKLPLKNRVVMAPMTRGFSPDGVLGDDVVEYYRRRAAGGVGLIISEGTTINHPAATDNTNYPKFWGEESLAAWKKVIDAVHSEGGKMVPQIWHLGSMRKQGTGHEPDAVTASPSGFVARGKKKLPALSVEEVEALVVAYAEAALAAKELGFDGVEVHGAHGYLVDTFFWDGTNEREDRYGGSIEKRTQFAVEIVKKIRELCGEEFPIILRFSQWTQTDYDARLVETPEELGRFLKPLCDAGVDIFHCSTRRFWDPEFEGSTLNLAGWTKKLSGKPTISVGSVGLNQEFITTYAGGEAEVANIDNLIERMEGDEFDLIAVGRALIANPEWTEIVKDGDMSKLKSFDKEILSELV